MTYPTPATSIAAPAVGPLIREEIVNGERLIELGASVLVASSTTPGAWYEVRDGSCQCSGYKWRRTCRHTVAVAALEVQVQREMDELLASEAVVQRAASYPNWQAPTITPAAPSPCATTRAWMAATETPTGQAALALCNALADS